MKTVPLDQEDDTELQDDCVSDTKLNCEDFKILGKNNNYETNSKCLNNEPHHSSESDNLIICNPDLAASFQTLKVEKHKLNPGHYLQKVFLNGLAQKFKSQSLPNNLEKKKYNQKNLGCAPDELKETSVPLVETTDGLSINLDFKESITEGWFKTWPERGLDKVTISSDDSYSEERIGNKNISHQEDNGVENKQSQSNTSCSEISSESKFVDTSSDLNYSTLDIVPKINSISNECYRPNSDNTKRKSKTIPLDELLDNFPLAYSPVTRQLHLIPQNQPEDKTDNNYIDKINCSHNLNTNKDNLKLEQKSVDKLGGGNGWTVNPTGSETDLSGGNNFNRVNNEVSSFSSTVSSLSDNSPSTNEDSALGSLLDHGDTSSLVSVGGCSAFSEDSIGERSKKKSISGFFSRNVFNWKSGSRSDDSIAGRGASWKLFGKNSSPLSSHTSLTVDYAESDGGSIAPDSPSSVRSSSSGARTFSHESRVASSSALIQLDRPANLPAKSDQESARHRLEYQQMVEAARKKEMKEAKHRKKQVQLQLRAEEQLAQATRVWTHEILPKWDHMSSSKKCRDLWWQGVPPCVRGKVWKLAIGNPLNLTQSLYEIYVQRAQDRLQSGTVSSDDGESDNKEASMEQIQLDISRTFPHLCIFQQGGPYYDMIHCLLAAYVCYRPDVGYVQGMSFIAAVLILNMEAADAFVCFANLLNRPCHMAFFHLNQPQMQAYYSTYNQLLKENLPQLYDHFTCTTLSPDLYLLDWIYTVFTKAMNLDLASRLWDVFLRDGDQFLFRAALGILHLCRDELLKMDFVHGSQFLTKLPDDLSADNLFKSISCIRMTVGKQTFQDILAVHSINCH